MTIFQYLLVLLLTFTLAACGDEETEDGKEGGKAKILIDPTDKSSFVPKVIYGKDDRLDLYQVTDSNVLALADSTVALVESSSLSKNADGSYNLSAKNFGTSYNLCASEPFREQDSGAFCSGSLVAPDTIITAGHCVTSDSDCADVKFVFGFAVKKAGVQTKKFQSNDVYSCAKIVHSQATDADFAVIKLDRPVTNHLPVRLRQSANTKVGTSLVVIGHPVGLPTKVAGGASVRSLNDKFFVANLDTYGGNSGSAVFNTTTGEVEGILVRGETDFTTQGNCRVSFKCQDSGCRGEDVTNIAQVTPFVSVVNPPPPEEENEVLVFTSKPNLKIPDNNAAGVVDTIKVSSSPRGRKVFVSVDLIHSWRGDLVVVLEAPDGQTAVLANRQGRNAQNLVGTFGRDLKPQSDLQGLTSVNSAGEWKLRVSDRARWDVGLLNSWTVEFAP